jgi:hypothetical protein
VSEHYREDWARATMATSIEAKPAEGVTPPHPGREVSRDEGLQMIDRQARRYLGISGAEFLRRWTRGDYAADPDQPGVMDVAMLLPFAHEERR